MRFKKLISLVLASVMLLLVILSSVSCDQLMQELLEEPVETEGAEETTDDTIEDTDSEEETTKKKNEITTDEKITDVIDEVNVEAYDGKPVTITFYHTMGSSLRFVLDKYIAEFNKMYPNITVEHTQVGGYDDIRDQITTELTVGRQPNLAFCYPEHVALYNIANSVVKLNDYIDSDLTVTTADGNTVAFGLTEAEIADFISAFYAEGATYDNDGTMYTLPMSKSTEVLYYNKTFFEEYGLAVPTTWDEMEQLCSFIKQIDPNCNPLGYDSDSNWFITLTAQFYTPYTSLEKGNNFQFDHEVNKNFVKLLREWYQNGYVLTQNTGGDYASSWFTNTGNSGRKCYMAISSSSSAIYHRIDGYEVGIAPIPQVNPEDPKAISKGPSLCMFDTGNSQEAAATWLFMKFLATNTEFQAEYAMASGYMPTVKSATETAMYQSYLRSADGYQNIQALAARVALEEIDYFFTLPSFNGMSVAADQVGYIMEMCLRAQVPDIDAYINEIFKAAIDECNWNI